jgi:hypothetical protein
MTDQFRLQIKIIAVEFLIFNDDEFLQEKFLQSFLGGAVGCMLPPQHERVVTVNGIILPRKWD